MLAGNHDHGLAAGWIDARLQTEPAGFLGLEERYAPTGAAGRATRRGRAARAPAVRLPRHLAARRRLRAARPLRRPARHRARPSSGSPRARWPSGSRRCRSERATPDDYEAVLSPLYAWLHALTQRADHSLVSKGGGASSSAYSALTRRTPRALALKTGYRGAVAGLNVARPRPAAGEPLTDGAAPRLPAAASAR